MTTAKKVLIGLGIIFIVLLVRQGSNGTSENLNSGESSDQPTIFSGVESRFGFQANFAAPGGGSWKTTLITYNWVFLPNGQMYRQLPGDGDSIGYCAHQDAANPCLTYTNSNIDLVITETTGSQTSYAFNGDELTVKPQVILRKVEPLNQSILSGKWHRSNYARSTGFGGSVGVGSEQQIYFDDAGNFANNKFSGFVGAGGLAGGYSSRSDIDQGTYAIDGYFLTLTYQDGFVAKHVAFKYPGEDVLSIDGRNFIK